MSLLLVREISLNKCCKKTKFLQVHVIYWHLILMWTSVSYNWSTYFPINVTFYLKWTSKFLLDLNREHYLIFSIWFTIIRSIFFFTFVGSRNLFVKLPKTKKSTYRQIVLTHTSISNKVYMKCNVLSLNIKLTSKDSKSGYLRDGT